MPLLPFDQFNMSLPNKDIIITIIDPSFLHESVLYCVNNIYISHLHLIGFLS